MTEVRPALGRLYDEHGDKLRFLVVGALNTAASYVLFLILLATIGPAIHSLASSDAPFLQVVGEHYYVVVQWINWILAIPVSTATMKYFAFRSSGRFWPQVGRAYFVYLPALALNSLVLWFAVSVLGLTPQLGQLLAIAVTTVFSYVGHKYFTFRTPLVVGEVPPEDGDIDERA